MGAGCHLYISGMVGARLANLGLKVNVPLVLCPLGVTLGVTLCAAVHGSTACILTNVEHYRVLIDECTESSVRLRNDWVPEDTSAD